MKRLVTLLAVTLLAAITTVSYAQSKEAPPAWAYPVNPPDLKLRPEDGVARRVPDSNASYTVTQLGDRFIAPAWHPNDHSPMPEVVASGRKPDVWACGYCHRADGPGGPENASLAGLPVNYIVQQMRDYKSGARKTSVPKRNIDNMISIAQASSDAEIQAAAAYFSALKPRQVVKVVESDIAPQTYVVSWHLAAVSPSATEPLGRRIVEVPEDVERFANRDSRARFIAYVPAGSIKRGQALAESGGEGRTVPCAACHGANLKGVGPIPGIVGRFASYTFRQLYDFKHGARAGTQSAQMKPTVEKLTVDDMADLAAYLASLAP